jgi:Ca-activated chloride channel family protein
LKPCDLSTFPQAPADRRGNAARLLATAAAAVLGIGLGDAPAQFRSNVNIIELYISVLDRDGRPVDGLTQHDFEVFENDLSQEVSVFAAGQVPLALAVALDRSFSVAGTRLAQMKRGTARLIGSLLPDDRLLLLGIGSRVDVLAPLGTDRLGQNRALEAVDAFGSTSLHDAIVVALDRIQDAPGRRALVLLSDGVDRYSQMSPRDVVAHAAARDVLVFPVAVGKPAPALFTELAAVTGGRSYAVREPSRLGETLQALASELRAQYMLGYVPSRAISGNREWRRIRVEVNRPGVTVRTRQGYWTR